MSVTQRLKVTEMDTLHNEESSKTMIIKKDKWNDKKAKMEK